MEPMRPPRRALLLTQHVKKGGCHVELGAGASCASENVDGIYNAALPPDYTRVDDSTCGAL